MILFIEAIFKLQNFSNLQIEYMNRILVLLLASAIFLAVDFYVYQAFKLVIQPLSQATQRILNYVYWLIPVISFSLVLGLFFIFPEYISFKVRNFMVSAVMIIYISKVLSVIFLLLDDLGRFFRWIFSFFQKSDAPTVVNNVVDESPKIPRSEFLVKTALAVGATNVGAMTFGILSGAHDYRVRHVKLALKNLPKKFDGMKIAQLSDIHSGSFFNKTAVKGGVEMLLKEKPDVAFFTGDLVNNEAREVKDYMDVFSKVKAPLGVYSTLGNHDYGDYKQWGSMQEKVQNLQDLKNAHKNMGWNLLLDEHKALTVDGESIGILGIQNWGAGGFAKYGDLQKTIKNTEDFPVKLLLSHDPSHWREQVLGKTDIDAAFAGHTHGMQYGVEIGSFKWSPVQFRYKEWAGLYEENDQKLYVNRGFGYIGYPGRVGILPEITIFELKAV